MRTRLRLGAVSAVGLGALLLATVLASPALAWHSDVIVSARCLADGQVRVHYTVKSSEKDEVAVVEVSYELNGQVVQRPAGAFGPHLNQFSDHFDLAAGTTGTITFTAKAHWESGEESTDQGSDKLPPAEKCDKDEETTTTTIKVEETTTTTLGDEEATTTTEDEVLGESSTTSPTGALPFTGASSGPMLLAGIALVGGGALFLWSSRTRGRHAAR